MEIRKGTRKDLPTVKEHLRKMWLRHDDKTGMMNRKVLEETDMKNYFKDCFNRSGRSILLIAEEEGGIVGFLKLNIEKLQKFFKEKRVVYLDDGYVIREYRKRGVMQKLIEEAEVVARKKKIKWLKGRIYVFNEPAQKMAKSVGLKPLYAEYFKELN